MVNVLFSSPSAPTITNKPSLSTSTGLSIIHSGMSAPLVSHADKSEPHSTESGIPSSSMSFMSETVMKIVSAVHSFGSGVPSRS
jgi:hypothetical protein